MYKARRLTRKSRKKSSCPHSSFESDFIEAKKRYNDQLDARKKEYRENFLQKASSDDACRMLRQMQRAPFYSSTIQKDCGQFTTSIPDTVQYALTKLFGDNISAIPEHKECHHYAPIYNLSDHEIQQAFTEKSDRKAPGYNQITGNILKYSFHALSDHFSCLTYAWMASRSSSKTP